MCSRGCRMTKAHVRPGLGRRLYLRIYLALLVSLLTAATLFAMAHMRYGGMPRSLRSIGGHLRLLIMLVIIAGGGAAAAHSGGRPPTPPPGGPPGRGGGLGG